MQQISQMKKKYILAFVICGSFKIFLIVTRTGDFQNCFHSNLIVFLSFFPFKNLVLKFSNCSS